MDRRDALKRMLLGIGGLTIAGAAGARVAGAAEAAAAAAEREALRTGACWVTPEETEGPFYFDPALDRADVREDKTGVRLALALNVIDTKCRPVPGAIVDVWHCDKDGLYSGYEQPAGDTTGQKFLRGSQVTDALGKASFTSVYPGWYQGRATHVHFKVRRGRTTYKTSQFAFPEVENARVYASPLYTARGANPTLNAHDGIFRSAAPSHLVVSLVGDPTRGYVGAFTIGLDAAAIDRAPKPARTRSSSSSS